jgi:spermidine synthase
MAPVYRPPAGPRAPAARARRARGPKRVEVHEGRRGRTLRVDGSFASFYTPGRAATGPVWDALAAPLLLLPPRRRRSVLLLGLGGGSAARLVRVLAPDARIVGVEIDPEVVRVARRWFDLDALDLEVVVSDALPYLREAARGTHDAVIEDIFVGRGRAVRKPEWLLSEGLTLAARRVARGGLLISNALDEAASVSRALAARFPQTLRIDVEDYDNRIYVASTRALSGRQLRRAVDCDPVLRESARALRFRRTRPVGGG